RVSGEIADEAYSHIDEAREILDAAEQKIFNVTERRVGGHTIELREAVNRLAALLREDRRLATGVLTGFTLLNEYTGGLQMGDLIIVAGRPSMGKTALGLTMAQHIAEKDRKPVLFFSLEMSQGQVAQRLLSAHTNIDAQAIRTGKLSEEQFNTLQYACAEFEEVPLFIDDSPGLTAMEVRATARRLKQKADIQAVFVDYLQLMHIPRAESRQVEIATISRGLKGLARELNIPVVAMAQLNRMPEGRTDKRPLMSDLRESGAIEQDADVVLLIHREEYYKRDDESVRGKADLIIAKQRNGPTADVQLQFNKKFTRFADLAMEPEPFETAPMDSAVPF
ncbi:MAG: replicative DNA helicase, partial [Phycisphaerae bacterium]